MTNREIITATAIQTGLYTQEVAEALIAKLGSLPLHTYAEWKRYGFQVKKGEKAKMKCEIWKHSTKAVEIPMKDGSKEETEEDRYFKKLAHFFTIEQVERIAA